MLVLGLSGNFCAEDVDLAPGMAEVFCHDASACLVRDGMVIAAVEEERLNRIKKTIKFPLNAIRACLAQGNVTPDELDAVAYYMPERHLDVCLNILYTEHNTVPARYSRQLLKDWFRSGLDWELPDHKLFYTPHHLAHALSTFARSGMPHALVVVMDGTGEEHAGTVYRADRGKLESLAAFPTAQSLGMLYLDATKHLGYRPGDEYKVMGLAPYGDPSTYRDVFDSLYVLREKGNYELTATTIGMNMIGTVFQAGGFPPRRKGEEFTQQHKDFAAGLQEMLEKIVLHVLTYWADATGLRKLCFGGGVAHNSTLNGVLLRSGLFDEVYVHPSSHDAGAAEGAALAVEFDKGSPRLPLPRMRSASLGPALGTPREVEAKLAAWGSLTEVEHCADIVETAAGLLADGAVLGWAQGRSEYGPRALGHRSILADARPRANQTRINAMIKKRESFRPFAPVVTPEAAATYFALPDATAAYDFMSFVVPVREDKRSELGAVTHVDGTARLQIVDPAACPRFHRLVTRFGQLTGTPVLLNTSFNNNAEPIVQTVDDALTCFLTTGLDYLVIEDFLIRRAPEGSPGFDDLVLRFRPVTRLTRTLRTTPAGRREVTREIYLDYSGGPRHEVSAELFDVLDAVDGHGTLATLGGEPTEALRGELHDLWQRRLIILTPA